MKVLHTSDWHLGQNFYGKSRAAEHQHFLNWLLSQVDTRQIDLVIVAGDIFDTGTPPSYAREMYFNFVVELHKHGCQLLIIAGNHDSVAVLSEAKQVLKPLGCHVVSQANQADDDMVFAVNNRAGEPAAVICALPYIRPRDVLISKAGQSSQDKQQDLQQAITARYAGLYERAQQLSDELATDKPALPIIGTGHLTVVGAKTTESVRDLYIGTLDAYPANLMPAFDYLALGHIHQPQKIAKTEHIRYCGSPIALSFDEAKQTKTVLLANFEQRRLAQVESISIPVYQRLAMVKTDLANLVADVTAELEQQSQADSPERVDSSEQKNSLEQKNSPEQVNSLERPKSPEQATTTWLDIELSASDYLSDLQIRLNQLLADFSVEILLVRRSKQARKAMTQTSSKLVLSELTLEEVFSSKLDELELETEPSSEPSSEQNTSKRAVLSEAFNQVVAQVREQNNVAVMAEELSAQIQQSERQDSVVQTNGQESKS